MQNIKIVFTASIVNLLLVVGSIVYFNSHMLPGSQPVQEIQIPEDTQTIQDETIIPPATNQVSQPTVIPATPASSQTATPQPQQTAPSVQKSNQCLIQIKGKVYDLAVFRAVHSGGDIFQCNTDMSAGFSQNHPDSYLNQLSDYLVR